MKEQQVSWRQNFIQECNNFIDQLKRKEEKEPSQKEEPIKTVDRLLKAAEKNENSSDQLEEKQGQEELSLKGKGIKTLQTLLEQAEDEDNEKSAEELWNLLKKSKKTLEDVYCQYLMPTRKSGDNDNKHKHSLNFQRNHIEWTLWNFLSPGLGNQKKEHTIAHRSNLRKDTKTKKQKPKTQKPKKQPSNLKKQGLIKVINKRIIKIGKSIEPRGGFEKLSRKSSTEDKIQVIQDHVNSKLDWINSLCFLGGIRKFHNESNQVAYAKLYFLFEIRERINQGDTIQSIMKFLNTSLTKITSKNGKPFRDFAWKFLGDEMTPLGIFKYHRNKLHSWRFPKTYRELILPMIKEAKKAEKEEKANLDKEKQSAVQSSGQPDERRSTTAKIWTELKTKPLGNNGGGKKAPKPKETIKKPSNNAAAKQAQNICPAGGVKAKIETMFSQP
jgi:hypothetical protein